MNKQPLSFVVLGGGTAGWIAANLLAKEFGKSSVEAEPTITLIESTTIGTIGVGEGTSPHILNFFKELDIPESEWMPACNATYKIGIEFRGWCEEESYSSYYHPFFGAIDKKSGSAFLRNCNLRRGGFMVDTLPDDFLVGSELCRLGKSPFAGEAKKPSIEYAYHFDAGLVAEFLKKKAIERGVKHVVDTVTEISQKANGDVAALTLASGETLRADYFIDCSGFASVLLGKTLGVNFSSISDQIINDSAVAIPTPIEVFENIKTQTTTTALSSGWVWKIPLTTRFGNGYVYSSAHLSKEDAESELKLHLNVGPDVDAIHLKMRLGRYDVAWKNNCVGVGLSQGFVEPLEATAIVYTYQCVTMFVNLFKKGNFTNKYQADFNKVVNKAFDTIVDYIHLHYILNTRTDTDYWEDVRSGTKMSDNLKSILDAWDDPHADFHKALSTTAGQVNFPPTSWYCLLSGKGRYPKITKKPAKPEVNKVMARKFISDLTRQFLDQQQVLAEMR